MREFLEDMWNMNRKGRLYVGLLLIWAILLIPYSSLFFGGYKGVTITVWLGNIISVVFWTNALYAVGLIVWIFLKRPLHIFER